MYDDKIHQKVSNGRIQKLKIFPLHRVMNTTKFYGRSNRIINNSCHFGFLWNENLEFKICSVDENYEQYSSLYDIF